MGALERIEATSIPLNGSDGLVRGHFGPAGKHLFDMVRVITKQIVKDSERHALIAFSLSNCGLFLAPDCATPVVVRDLEQPLTPEAAGIVCTMLAYQRLHGARVDPLFGSAFFLLRNYACTHPEWDLIRQLID